MNNLYLRDADFNDLKLLYKWVNDDDVRYNSLNQAIITWENHKKWFESKINNISSKIYILTDGDNNFGQIRIDRELNFWVIDYSIESKNRGKGYGFLILELLIDKHKNFNFKAFVRKENLSSIRIFLKLGFKKIVGPLDDIIYFEK
ncbi:GNAT family N-acetyltransferase [Sediminibacterium sp. C3]|uniref:GNAT family N-acetyltransferase n=1 Tax=Sediminibacterium sp. C3 TaxID=1267211 RepID=UPI000688099A|nr:GNAT family N-acetyltransferase [Sediminibacterium sp. C3]